MIPGMAHRGGGTGPAHLDLLPAVRAWVESGVVPEKITVVPVQNGAPAGRQMLCPYPERAHAYPGFGSTAVCGRQRGFRPCHTRWIAGQGRRPGHLLPSRCELPDFTVYLDRLVV